MKIIQYTDEVARDVGSNGSYFIKFSTPTCTGCKLLARTIQSVGPAFDAPLIEVDATEHIDYARRFMVRSVPVLLFVNNNGLESAIRYTGSLVNEQELTTFFKECLHV